MRAKSLLRVSELTKTFGGVHALTSVSLEIATGEVHALCGENGAGKSTLIKILTGVTSPDSGEIHVSDHPLEPGSVPRSEAAGIAVIHQESSVFPDLNTVQNLFVGRELTQFGGWWLDHRQMRDHTLAVLNRLGETFDWRVPVRLLTVAQRQLVALARALSRDCRLLILDEPTASLSARETTTLLGIIRQLRADGVGVLYVSHRLEEVFQLADRVTILRDGRHVSTDPIAQLTLPTLIQRMVGRTNLAASGPASTVQPVPHPARSRSPGSPEESPPGDDHSPDELLRVSRLTRGSAFQDITFSIRRGEVVGMAGLVGAGRTEVARAIFGIDPYDAGTVAVGGVPLRAGSVERAIAAGIGLVPEDRQHEGLVLPMSVGENLSLAQLWRFCLGPFLHARREQSFVARQLADLQVHAASSHLPVHQLSGGNQQKVVLGKWLSTNPRVLILDEPTRGVDVGAKAQVHRLIRDLATRGVAVLVISSELPELLTLCDRLLVMREGRLVGDLPAAGATQEQVLAMALPDAAPQVVEAGR